MTSATEFLRAPMDRRTFFTISGAAVSALAADWAAGPMSALAQAHDGKPIGEDFVVFLENTTQQLAGFATEQRQHTAVLLDSHLSTVTELLEHGRYTHALGLRLHTLAASLSQTVAWHRFDLGHHTHASQNWIAGLHNAHAAGDHDMGAGLLGDLAYQAAWRRDHTTAANILNYALTRAQNPAARCLLQLRLARTLAAQGDRSERRAVLRALAAAEKHLGGAGANRPAWVSEADLVVDSGQALLDLGDIGRAHRLITEGEGLLPPARDKTRGVFLAYRAASYLDLKEPEPAAAAATESPAPGTSHRSTPLRAARRRPSPPLPALPGRPGRSGTPPARCRIAGRDGPMTTDAGLPSVRESLQLAVLTEGEGSPLVGELAEAAADHYHLNYSKHPVPVLFREVHAARSLLAGLAGVLSPGTELHRQVGRLSGLLGNLAFHLDDPAGARTHLGTAVSYANRCGDTALAAWAYGAQSMVARHTGNLTAALAYAERGAAAAPAGLVRAQLHAWAPLPTLAQQGRDREAAAALDVALTELEADPAGQAPGRFGFDEPELALHQAEARLTLGRTDHARARAEASAAACTPGTPGWAAATLVLAQAEASDQPSDAAQRALDVPDRVPPSRLRATARTRLQRLEGLLAAHPAEYVADLRERLRTLPPSVDASGGASA